MGAERAFYVAQGSLSVWSKGSADPADAIVFPDSDDGLRSFDSYLAANAEATSFILIDVIEEEFAAEEIPRIGRRDRAALMQRRLQRRFSRTSYRLSAYHGKQERDADHAVAIHSAVSNHELLDPWLRIIARHGTPLTGIYSVPLIAAGLAARLFGKLHPVMFLSQHQEHKLRQVFLHRGLVQSARLSQSPPVADPDYPAFVVTEIHRSRRYLERTRLLGADVQLEVCVVADRDLASRIVAQASSDSPTRFHFIEPAKAARRAGVAAIPQVAHMEALYIADAFRHRPRQSYAVSGETRFWQMRRLQHAIIGTAVAAAVVCAVVAGLLFSDAWLLGRQTRAIEDQLAQLTASFRRDNEQFDPIKADSQEMKIAVDTGDYILANRLPVPWVMQQVGLVMGDYPDVRIRYLGWAADAAAVADPAPQRRRDQVLPVAVPAIVAVTAEIDAEIAPFNGDMRAAFARIDALVADLSATTAFEQVVAVEYPLDASPQSSLAGEIVERSRQDSAHFRLRLTLPLSPAAPETNDDRV